jgi:hypothetical protein
MAAPKVTAGFDFKRLGGGVNFGSNAFYRKVATQDARLNMANIIAEYTKLLRKFKVLSPAACETALKPIFKRAQYLVPEDTGALWESGQLTSGVNSKGAAYADITFGNEEAWYAALVHEYTWQKHEAPTRSKYLQVAMEEGLGAVMDTLKAEYSKALHK